MHISRLDLHIGWLDLAFMPVRFIYRPVRFGYRLVRFIGWLGLALINHNFPNVEIFPKKQENSANFTISD